MTVTRPRTRWISGLRVASSRPIRRRPSRRRWISSRATTRSGSVTGRAACRSARRRRPEKGPGSSRASRSSHHLRQGRPGELTRRPPRCPRRCALFGVADEREHVAWSPSSDDIGVAGYGRYRGTSRVGTTTSQTAPASPASPAGPRTGRRRRVRAAGNRSSRADMTVTTAACADTQAPCAPSNVVVGTRTGTSIALLMGAVQRQRRSRRVRSLSGRRRWSPQRPVRQESSTGLYLRNELHPRRGRVRRGRNRSAQAVVMVATAACADTQAPTAPTGLTFR